MKGGFATQRRADRFDALLSGELVDADESEAELLALVGSMREVPDAEARPEFVASLRGRLMTEAATLPASALDRATVDHLSLHQPTVRRERRIATVLGGLAIASATTSMAVASQGALPGETLYPVKRAIENAQSSLQADGAEKSHTLLDHAELRLTEVRELSTDGSGGTEVAEALDGLNNQTTEAATLAIDDYRESGDDQGVRDVRAFAERALGELTTLRDVVPESARPALVVTVNALRNVEAAAEQACATCGGPAELPDQALVANLENLLSGDPEALLSLAQSAEDIAANAPTTAPTRPSPEAGPTTAPSAPSAPSPTPAPGKDPSPTPNIVPDPPKSVTNSKGPLTTLLDGVRTDLEDTRQQAEDEDWTLLDNGLIDGLTSGLGLTSSDD